MAAIIDGTTYSGYWKLTPNDASPNDYYLIPKGEIFFNPTASGIFFTSDNGSSAAIIGIPTLDGDGNTLADNAAVSEYISIWR